MKQKLKNMVTSFIGYGLIVIIVLAVISVLAIFGGAIMRLFGFEYNSVGSIILFFCMTAVIGFSIEITTKAISKALLSLNRISLNGVKMLFVVLDTLSTIIAMMIVDYFMDSVSAGTLSIFAIALIMAVISVRDLHDKNP